MKRYYLIALSLILVNLGALLAGCSHNLPQQLTYCSSPRPQICTREYRPVCGYHDTYQKTYATGCVACSNPSVIGYLPGPCEEVKAVHPKLRINNDN